MQSRNASTLFLFRSLFVSLCLCVNWFFEQHFACATHVRTLAAHTLPLSTPAAHLPLTQGCFSFFSLLVCILLSHKPSSFLHALYTHSEHSCARSSSTSLRVLSCRRQMRLPPGQFVTHTLHPLILFRLCFDCLLLLFPVSIDPRDLLRLSSRACAHSQLRTNFVNDL